MPHEIPEDYTVDWETCTAYCPDDVVFAMRFGDTSGRWTEARTDTFAYDVPVALISAPWFTVIRPWSCSPVLAGFMLTKSRRRPVTRWSGERMPLAGWTSMAKTGHGFTSLGQSVGAMEQKMEAETNGKLYALAYGACVDTLSLWCHKLVPTRISWVESGVKVLVSEGHIRVAQAEGMGLFGLPYARICGRAAQGGERSLKISSFREESMWFA